MDKLNIAKQMNLKNSQLIAVPIFTLKGLCDPKVMVSIESGLSKYFILHLENSNQTYS